MISRLFVTGTDTDAGKSLISAALLEKARQQGRTTFGLKPVAAGCVLNSNTEEWQNADALLLQRHSEPQRPYNTHNPVALQAAIAPHIAARQEGTPLKLAALRDACEERLPTDSDLILVEGAGGWLVPLNYTESLADLAVALNYPVVLVVGLRLGCISHALLSAEAILSRGLPIAGWVANSLSAQMDVETENLEFLTQSFDNMGIPCLGHVPFLRDLAARKVGFDAAGGNPLSFMPAPEYITEVASYLTLP
ncbi:dethiobiotin synthase [Parathalassolituus penaei]|uniref:ATP-dependent dethiobiotin synthetase BioD n=1 Tax=Parathalassolituus penaei TaxID=2997323 RepID=A0A9X3IQ22_9GAMM|nr:dethiobiotin synthase [Parathalassolituus penaei]MCY0963697.1 dethiobiotin synthase [Parathalassolituus penaei]